MPLSRIKQIVVVPRYSSNGVVVPNATVVSQVGVVESAISPTDKSVNRESISKSARAIDKRLVGVSVFNLSEVDDVLRAVRGDKSVSLSTSMAVSRLAAKISFRELYQLLRDECLYIGHGWRIPDLVVTLAESDNQRLLAVIPSGLKKISAADLVSQAINLQLTFGKKAQSAKQAGIGISGGYKVENVIDVRLWQLAKRALESVLPKQAILGLDLNADKYFDSVSKRYYVGNESALNRVELAAWMRMVGRQYGVQMFVDPIVAKDWSHWSELKNELRDSQVVVGMRALDGNDHLLARAHHADSFDIASCRLSGAKTVSDILQFVMQSRHYGMRRMCSISTNETEDSFLVDVAMAGGVEYLDIGGPLGSEHSSKYNRLLTIAEQEKL